MKRLTKRYDTHIAVICENCDKKLECNGGVICGEVLRERLAAYEDAMPLEREQELVQAEKDGRLVVLPCSLHQPLYILKNDEIHRNYGCQWHFTDKECQTFGTLSLYGEFVSLDDFGKTVFLTREEAEAALKKREDAQHEN